MPSKKSGTVKVESTPVPQSTIFSTDADVIIRAAGTRDLCAHKLILSLVSPVFKDMFSVLQPSTDTLYTPSYVDVEESTKTWDNILQTIYPVPRPVIDNLDDLESLLLTAMKYQMQPIIDLHKAGLENRVFMREDPLRLYAIACACGLEDQAKYVARNAELLTVTKRSDAGDLRGLTLDSYHSLVSILTQRDNEWHRILSQTQPPNNHHCRCHKSHVETVYNNIKENLKAGRLPTEVHLKAFADQRHYLGSGCRGGNCSVSDLEIKTFIEQAVKQREILCTKFIPGTLVPGPQAITSYLKVRIPRWKFNSVLPWNGLVSLSLTIAFCSCIVLLQKIFFNACLSSFFACLAR